MLIFIVPIIIYISFISLGLPDGLLGAAWPTMGPEMGAPVSYAGIISIIYATGGGLAVLDIVDKHLKVESGEAPVLPTVKTESAVCKQYIERKMPVSTPVFEIGIKDDAPSLDAVTRLKRDVAMTVLDEMLFSRAGELYNELFESGMINESSAANFSLPTFVSFAKW